MKQLPNTWKQGRVFKRVTKISSISYLSLQFLSYGLVLLAPCDLFFKHIRAVLGVLQKRFKKPFLGPPLSILADT